MGSKKRSAQAKQVAAFRASLDSFAGNDEFGDIFAREKANQSRREREHDAALRVKACESKNRYETRAEAEEAIAACADYGTRGLHCYRCSYCDGWHLTSKPAEGRSC